MFVLVLLENKEENIAVVHSKKEEYLIVSYLSFFKKTYKGTKVYSFEKSSEYVSPDQILSEYETMDELHFVKIGENMYAESDAIDDDSSSEIEDDEDEEEGVGEYYSDDGFVVPDDEEILMKPADYKEIDEKWKEWKPVTSGAKRFKERVDQIEAYMNHQIDEKFVFKN